MTVFIISSLDEKSEDSCVCVSRGKTANPTEIAVKTAATKTENFIPFKQSVL